MEIVYLNKTIDFWELSVLAFTAMIQIATHLLGLKTAGMYYLTVAITLGVHDTA